MKRGVTLLVQADPASATHCDAWREHQCRFVGRETRPFSCLVFEKPLELDQDFRHATYHCHRRLPECREGDS